MSERNLFTPIELGDVLVRKYGLLSLRSVGGLQKHIGVHVFIIKALLS